MNRKQGDIYVLATLAVFMHLAMQLTPLWIPDSSQFSIQICTAQGLQTINLESDTNESEAPRAAKFAHECACCPPAISTLAFSQALNTPYISTTESLPLLRSKRVEQPRFHKAHQSRAPPQYT